MSGGVESDDEFETVHTSDLDATAIDWTPSSTFGGAVGSKATLRIVMTSLADIVLPVIRTRADLSRWSAANAHGSDMHAAIDALEAARPSTDPAEFHAVVHAALASAVKVIARADDSRGIIGDACSNCTRMPRPMPGSRRASWWTG